MARFLSAPRRFLVFLLTLVVSLLQGMRAQPSGRWDGIRRVSARRRLDHGLLFRLGRRGSGVGGARHYELEATGAFPYVRLRPGSGLSRIPVPVPVQVLAASSEQVNGSGLQHAAVSGLPNPAVTRVRPACDSCGSCGGCGSCGSCASCSSCSCGSSCTSCGTSCATSCGNCAGNCGSCMGFGGSCGGSCIGCASCASCLSCSSCTCTSCASCGSCGSCSSCAK